MAKLLANGLQLEVESIGEAGDPAVLLIMGLGTQLVAWPDPFCRTLADAGFRVIRFDNRDIGLSQRVGSKQRINLPAATMRYLLHLPVPAPYRISDMAVDSVGVLDGLDVASAHLVGASMGGMIAQAMAADFPDRCRSLVSIMSSSGSRRLPSASWRVGRMLLSRPPANAPYQAVEDHFVRLFELIGSPGFPTPPDELRKALAIGLQRGYYPAGTARQLLAIIASGDRSPQLKRIATPTLVLHGNADRLVPVKHGIDCARKIPGAKLKLIPGMGHDLAPGLLPILSEAVIEHLQFAQAGKR